MFLDAGLVQPDQEARDAIEKAHLRANEVARGSNACLSVAKSKPNMPCAHELAAAKPPPNAAVAWPKASFNRRPFHGHEIAVPSQSWCSWHRQPRPHTINMPNERL